MGAHTVDSCRGPLTATTTTANLPPPRCLPTYQPTYLPTSEAKAAVCVIMLVSDVSFEAVYFKLPLAAAAKCAILLFSMLFQALLVHIVGQEVFCGCRNRLFISYDKDSKSNTTRDSNKNMHHRRMLGSKHAIYTKSSVNLFASKKKDSITSRITESARTSVESVSSMVSVPQWNMERLWGLRLRLESAPYEGAQAFVTIVQSSLFFYYMQARGVTTVNTHTHTHA